MVLTLPRDSESTDGAKGAKDSFCQPHAPSLFTVRSGGSWNLHIARAPSDSAWSSRPHPENHRGEVDAGPRKRRWESPVSGLRVTPQPRHEEAPSALPPLLPSPLMFWRPRTRAPTPRVFLKRGLSFCLVNTCGSPSEKAGLGFGNLPSPCERRRCAEPGPPPAAHATSSALGRAGPRTQVRVHVCVCPRPMRPGLSTTEPTIHTSNVLSPMKQTQGGRPAHTCAAHGSRKGRM